MKLDIPDFSNIKHYTNKKKFRNRHPLLPQWAFNMIISGPTGSGKSWLTYALICKFLVFDKLYLYTRHTDQPGVQMLITFFEKIEKKTGEEILHLENDIENLIPLDDINPELLKYTFVICFKKYPLPLMALPRLTTVDHTQNIRQKSRANITQI